MSTTIEYWKAVAMLLECYRVQGASDTQLLGEYGKLIADYEYLMTECWAHELPMPVMVGQPSTEVH